jgi:hypothetical protein
MRTNKTYPGTYSRWYTQTRRSKLEQESKWTISNRNIHVKNRLLWSTIEQYTIPQTQTRKQSSSIKFKRLHYPTRSMRVDWYKARNSKWFILAKPRWKWNICSPTTLNKLMRTMTLLEHKPAQAQSKGRYFCLRNTPSFVANTKELSASVSDLGINTRYLLYT